MSFPYPDKPWQDGAEVTQLQDDGTIITATYDLANNVWNMVRTNPSSGLTEFVTDQQVLITPREDSIRSKLGSLYVESTEPSVATQYDVNDSLIQTDVLSSRNIRRTSDLIDFTNNSVCQAYWVHTEQDNDPYPNTAEFWAYDENGVETTEFINIRKIIFNDNGIAANPGTENVLENVRVGDYLIIQEVNQNHFGMYVIASKITYQGSIREFGVKLFKDARGFGDCQYLAHCSVRVTRPEYVVVQNEQPFVSSRGVLWYRESDDVLSISNFGDGFVGDGPQWTEINSSDTTNLVKKDGDIMTGRLKLREEGDIIAYDYTTSKDLVGQYLNVNLGGIVRGPVIHSHTGSFGIGTQYLDLKMGMTIFADEIVEDELHSVDLAEVTNYGLDILGEIKFQEGAKLTGLPDPVTDDQPVTLGFLKSYDGGGVGGGQDEYLPLTGGSISGSLSVAGSLSNQGGVLVAGPSDKALQVYDLNGGAVLQAYCSKFGGGVQYHGSIELPDHVTTKSYVDNAIAAIGDSSNRVPGLAKYKYAGDRNLVNLRPGEFCGFDAENNPQSVLASISTIAFHGQDLDGNRPAPDDDVVSFDLSWASVFQILNSDATKTYLRATGGSHKLDDYLVFQYNKDVDIYYVAWADDRQVAFLSTFQRFTNSQTVTLRFPDWFI